MITIALAGNPNCGKTTLFNRLTGSKQHVGNWPGVTVEKKSGTIVKDGESITIVDLPGIYSLSPYTMEELVARDFITHEHPDVVLNIVDGTNIERNLYLTLQLMELGIPTVVAVNMIDEMEAKNEKLDCAGMAKALGAPVIGISARKGTGIEELILRVIEVSSHYQYRGISYNPQTDKALADIRHLICPSGRFDYTHIDFFAAKLLEGDKKLAEDLRLGDEANHQLEEIISAYEKTSQYGDRETMLADARYRLIAEIVDKTVVKDRTVGKLSISDRIDRFATNKYLAIPIFLLIMLVMFLITFGFVGESLKSGVEWIVNDLIAPGVSSLLTMAGAPDWTFGLLIQGVIGGVGGVLSFLPQIMLLFLFLSVMEDSGYMSRAAFIMDRMLRKIGLNGKSFIPMLMGFGCTVPAVMAARTMENIRDRRLTIMLTPFMSCGARLPVYALFAGIFFEKHQGLVVFSMYILGMLVAILSGFLLRKTLFKGESSTFVMELPPYRLPSLKNTLLHMWDKCKGFLIKAGTLIFSMTIIVWLFQNFDFTLHMVTDSSTSIFGVIGSFIAPVFAPLGFGTWQAAVAILTGLVAKEAVVSSMLVLYGANEAAGLVPVLSQVFNPVSAYAFMTFILLYMPCVAAFSAIRKEMGSAKWTAASVLFQTGVAYIVALLVNQVGTLLFL